MTNEEAKFIFTISGVNNYDEQCRIHCILLDVFMKLGYNCNSKNFEVNFEKL